VSAKLPPITWPPAAVEADDFEYVAALAAGLCDALRRVHEANLQADALALGQGAVEGAAALQALARPGLVDRVSPEALGRALLAALGAGARPLH
jgi:hypothetical protein